MSESTWLILLHQLLFQGMFFAKNFFLRRKLQQSIRGFNPEANLAIAFFVVFIAYAIYLSLTGVASAATPPATRSITGALALLLMLASLAIGGVALQDLGDSWRVGVIQEQQTQLIENGIYRYSRNPFFVAYLLMFAAYTVLLHSPVLLLLSLTGFAMVHAMILREEKYLGDIHTTEYEHYKQRVPRYVGVTLRRSNRPH